MDDMADESSAYVPPTRDERIRTTALDMAREMCGDGDSLHMVLRRADILRAYLAGEDADGPLAAVAETLRLKPDETLIIRVPVTTTAHQVEDMVTWYEWQRAHYDIAVKYLIVAGDGLAVQAGEP